jgi:hypothetical protein
MASGCDELSRTSNAPVARQNSAARLVNVIVDPAAAFRGISDSAPWGVAFVAAVALRFGSLFIFYRPSVTPLKLIGGVLFQIATIAPLLLVSAAVIWLVSRVWRVALAWASSFSVVTHIYVAYTLATIAIASVTGALLPESTEVDLRSPPFTNFAGLLPDSEHQLLQRLVAEADVRSLYAVALLWIGLRGAASATTRLVVAKVIATVLVVRVVGVIGIQMIR